LNAPLPRENEVKLKPPSFYLMEPKNNCGFKGNSLDANRIKLLSSITKEIQKSSEAPLAAISADQ
jgi:hypothetical protein